MNDLKRRVNLTREYLYYKLMRLHRGLLRFTTIIVVKTPSSVLWNSDMKTKEKKDPENEVYFWNQV